MPFETEPALMRAGHRTSMGTRTPPSHVVAFSPRKGVTPPSGHHADIEPLSVVKRTIVLSAAPSSSRSESRSPTSRSSSIRPLP